MLPVTDRTVVSRSMGSERGVARRAANRLRRLVKSTLQRARTARQPADARADTRALQALTNERRYDEAVGFAAERMDARSGDKGFLAAAGAAFTKAGALTHQAQLVAAQRRLGDSARLRRQERLLRGRLQETEPGWLPYVPESSAPRQPAVSGRVLHLLKASLPYRQSGYTMRSQYLLDSQHAAGLDPVALTALGFPRQIGVTDAPPEDEVHGTRHVRLDAAPAVLDGPFDLYLDAYAMAAAAIVAEVAPELLHVHSGHRGYEAALVGLALARRFDLPLVYEVRGFFESLWSRDLDWNERGEAYERRFATETRCLTEADAVVTLSESMRAEIIARGVPADHVFVVPNGVDTDVFRPGERRRDLVDRLGLGDAFTFGYVSNLDHYREGHEALVEAAVALRQRGVPAVALIIGDGSRRDELEALADRLDAKDAVVFTGKVPHDEVLDYYRLLDVFVVPRVAERAARLVTPLKPFEAMAAGLPVVVSDLEALLEIIGGGERGRAFRAGDAESLAETLVELYEDPGLRSELAERGRTWVVAERQWSANALAYAEIYATAKRSAANS